MSPTSVTARGHKKGVDGSRGIKVNDWNDDVSARLGCKWCRHPARQYVWVLVAAAPQHAYA